MVSNESNSTRTTERASRYWRTNVWVIGCLLVIWFAVSCLGGIVLIEPLNKYTIGHIPLGFWIAHQGSMLAFVLLILVYAITMDLVDRRFRSIGSKGRESK